MKEAETAQVFGGSRYADPTPWRISSPVNHVTAGVPPVLIVHGEKDATVDLGQSLELEQALARHGAVHRFFRIKDAGHTFDLETWNEKPLSLDVRGLVLGFLAEQLKPVAP